MSRNSLTYNTVQYNSLATIPALPLPPPPPPPPHHEVDL